MKRSLLVCVSALSIFLAQCTKDPLNNLTTEESRIYVTNYDTTVAFSTYKTFKVVDSVANIVNNQLQSKTRDALDAQIIDAVRSSLAEPVRGFTNVAANQTADLGVTVSTITNTSTHLVDYSNYGGYYGGYWDPYYWGYSDYYAYDFPTYYGIYQTNETVLSIDIIDLKNAAQNNKLDVIWSGLIRGSNIFSSATINDQIGKLFAQSPYLKTNQ